MIRTTLGFFLLFLISPAIAQQAKQLAFHEEIYDFGVVEENKGPVTHEFVFTNNSSRPVKILKVQASCGCTTPGWSKEAIPPGKDGFIQASYNPMGRPGFFNKSLTVMTDLQADPVILQIKGQVTNEEAPSPLDYPKATGNLKMKVSSFNMGRVYLRDEWVVREFPILNGGKDAIEFNGKFVSPAYVQVDVDPRKLAPGEKGVIRVSYNGAMKNQYGFQSDNIEIETDDSLVPVKSFSVYATLEDFFPQMTSAELAQAPQLTFSSYTLDLGNVTETMPLVREIAFTNTGRKALLIKSIQPNCSCVTAEASKTSLKPGETAMLKISFHPQDRSGTQNKAISVYTNDPRRPVQRLTFTAYIP